MRDLKDVDMASYARSAWLLSERDFPVMTGFYILAKCPRHIQSAFNLIVDIQVMVS